MANQISKEKLVEYLNEQVQQYHHSTKDVIHSASHQLAIEATYSTYNSLRTLIENGVFDEQR